MVFYCVMSQDLGRAATSKGLLKSCRSCCLLTCQAGIKRSPIIISLFLNESIVYLHLGWQPSRACRAVGRRGVEDTRKWRHSELRVFAWDPPPPPPSFSLAHVRSLVVLARAFTQLFAALGKADLAGIRQLQKHSQSSKTKLKHCYFALRTY